jgi:hypothetical protein
MLNFLQRNLRLVLAPARLPDQLPARLATPRHSSNHHSLQIAILVLLFVELILLKEVSALGFEKKFGRIHLKLAKMIAVKLIGFIRLHIYKEGNR